MNLKLHEWLETVNVSAKKEAAERNRGRTDQAPGTAPPRKAVSSVKGQGAFAAPWLRSS